MNGTISDTFTLGRGTQLYLADASQLLRRALDLFKDFGRFSGICTNWGKSVLFPLHPSLPKGDTGTLLQWVGEFTYLGIKISNTTHKFTEKNVQPLLYLLTVKCTAWRTLLLTPVGRVNLLKIVFLSKFLYFFHKTPSHIPRSFFRRLEGVLTSFIWARKPPRVAKRTLYLPLSGGGLALLNFLLY